MDIVIRRYNHNDFLKVSKLILDNFGEKNEALENVPSYITRYVAEVDNEIVGFFVLTDIINVVKGFHYYLVDYVCVDVTCHGKGIGKFMINYVISKAYDENIKYIQLTSSNKRPVAQKMYKSLGFVEYDTNLYRLVI